MQDILTEKEAKTRWCPLTFGAAAEGAIKTTCRTSECMAWRLAHKDAADGTERGYCGAFGLPRFT